MVTLGQAYRGYTVRRLLYVASQSLSILTLYPWYTVDPTSGRLTVDSSPSTVAVRKELAIQAKRVTSIKKKLENCKPVPKTWIAGLESALTYVKAAEQLGGMEKGSSETCDVLIAYLRDIRSGVIKQTI